MILRKGAKLLWWATLVVAVARQNTGYRVIVRRPNDVKVDTYLVFTQTVYSRDELRQ
jgi:hypothetical protein